MVVIQVIKYYVVLFSLAWLGLAQGFVGTAATATLILLIGPDEEGL